MVDTKGKTLGKFLSYNIFYQNIESRKDNIFDLILKCDPDVMGLQEVSVDWIKPLSEFMSKNGYSYYGYGRYGGEFSEQNLNNGEQFVLILWKTDKFELLESGHFWLSSTPEVYSANWIDGVTSKFPRCINWVKLKEKESGHSFAFVNVHTAPDDATVRTYSSRLIVEQMKTIASDIPVIMAGDWNMGLSDDAYLAVVQNGYSDVRVIAGDTEFGGSFNNWGARKEGNFAFGDHIFVTEGIAAKSFHVVNDLYDGKHISDHCPLLAEIYY